MNKTYELPLVRGYVARWGVVEAVRELLQNAIDSESPFRCIYLADRLRIVSENSVLPARTLLLGATSKADDETKIGSFGEGYKIAMLVLTREEKYVTIYNGDVIWNPRFLFSESFDEETLHVSELKRTPGWSDSLIFEVDNVLPHEYESIYQSCKRLWTDDEIGEVYHTRYGDILMDHPGKIFVNGLFVCNMKLDSGYDIKPEYIKLERDRQTVSDFDMKWLTKQMWFDTGRHDEVAEKIENNSPDLEYAQHNTPVAVREACFKRHDEKYHGRVAVKSQAEAEHLLTLSQPVFVNPVQHAILNQVPEYRKTLKTAEVSKPIDYLEKWFKRNRGSMRKDAIVSFKDILKQAQNWTIGS